MPAHRRRVIQAKLSDRKYHDLRCAAYLGFLSQISGLHTDYIHEQLV